MVGPHHRSGGGPPRLVEPGASAHRPGGRRSGHHAGPAGAGRRGVRRRRGPRTRPSGPRGAGRLPAHPRREPAGAREEGQRLSAATGDTVDAVADGAVPDVPPGRVGRGVHAADGSVVLRRHRDAPDGRRDVAERRLLLPAPARRRDAWPGLRRTWRPGRGVDPGRPGQRDGARPGRVVRPPAHGPARQRPERLPVGARPGPAGRRGERSGPRRAGGGREAGRAGLRRSGRRYPLQGLRAVRGPAGRPDGGLRVGRYAVPGRGVASRREIGCGGSSRSRDAQWVFLPSRSPATVFSIRVERVSGFFASSTQRTHSLRWV